MRCFLIICFLGIFFSFGSFSADAQSILTSMEISDVDSKKIENQILVDETNIDEIFGPEQDFPFLPDNHRDNSSPIGRIGKISDLP